MKLIGGLLAFVIVANVLFWASAIIIGFLLVFKYLL